MTTIKPGDKVHWTHVGGGKRILSMRRREGVVLEVDTNRGVAKVRRGKKEEWIDLKRLRTEGQKSQVTELVEGMVEAVKKPRPPFGLLR